MILSKLQEPTFNSVYCWQEVCTYRVCRLVRFSNAFSSKNSKLVQLMIFLQENHNKMINPLYTGRLFQCYMLDKSICHFRGAWSILSLLFYFSWKILLANTVDPDQRPHYLASDLGLHCLSRTLLWVSQNDLKKVGTSP